MSYPSPKDIAEMKARGYDPATIAEVEERMWRGQEREEAAREIVSLVETAFAGVTLGDGVGLRHGMAMDDWADAATCAAYRAEDEQHDWHSIPIEMLNRCACSLSYFDAEGMRFHLPAFLLAELRGEGIADLTFHLASRYDGSETSRAEKFALFSPAQRAAVRAYLLLLLQDPDEVSDHDDIAHALAEYWTNEPGV